MNLDDIIPLIYENTDVINVDLQRPIPQADPELLEIKIEKVIEGNLTIKNIIPSPKRSSNLNDISQTNKFPILIPGKVKLPIFISFDITTEKIKGKYLIEIDTKHDLSFLEELTILYDHETVNNINLQDKVYSLLTI